MIITEILARNARLFPDDTALVERDPANGTRKSITWTEFDSVSNRIANALVKRGVKKGGSVVHLMTNCLEWLPVYFGILRTGAKAVPLNFRFTEELIAMCANVSEASVIFFGEEFIDRVASAKTELDLSITTYIFTGPKEHTPRYAEHLDDFIKKSEPEFFGPEIIITDNAAIYFTSGTTGVPKGVLLTHRNLEFSCYVENNHHSQKKEDSFLCIPPLYHTGAKMHWFGNFLVGAPAVILKGIKPDWILEAVSEEKVSIVWLLVPWAHDILLAIERGEIKLDNYDLSRWRLMHIGAQPVPPSLIQKWGEVFPLHEFDVNYGLTEATGPGCLHLGIPNRHKTGSIGIAGFDWEFSIVDRNLDPVPLGEPGELIVKGPGVMKEYFKNPKETATSLVNGWLRTGDIARIDKDGFVWLLDRKKDVIITGGENIYPVEIEHFLSHHARIQDVAVIGIPDERLGEVVAAVIKLKPGKNMTEEEVMTLCELLPRYKRPKFIYFDDVPRNPTGKIEKPALRKKYAGIYSSFKMS
ncbi:class I adenylate-forming enzyme family protein [Desulforegula conservatrix]|uniref:class I adenylate-forming enzyme family protein n=1 Tax=Desulforegula conservatrix TaxID=153026 RepID=UPI0003FFF9F7|nr:AMP-binding protein [Desulforegula conservatrix]